MSGEHQLTFLCGETPVQLPRRLFVLRNEDGTPHDCSSTVVFEQGNVIDLGNVISESQLRCLYRVMEAAARADFPKRTLPLYRNWNCPQDMECVIPLPLRPILKDRVFMFKAFLAACALQVKYVQRLIAAATVDLLYDTLFEGFWEMRDLDERGDI